MEQLLVEAGTPAEAGEWGCREKAERRPRNHPPPSDQAAEAIGKA